MTLDKLLSHTNVIIYKNAYLITPRRKEDMYYEYYMEWLTLPRYKKIEFVALFIFKDSEYTYHLMKNGNGWSINCQNLLGSIRRFAFDKMQFIDSQTLNSENITTDFFLCLDIIEKELS